MSELDTIGFGLIIIVAAVGGAAVLTWFERRLLGVWQDRYGPNRLGPFGVLQVLADMVKLLTKHDWVPPFADRLDRYRDLAVVAPPNTMRLRQRDVAQGTKQRELVRGDLLVSV